jgi:hypothetical protein
MLLKTGMSYITSTTSPVASWKRIMKEIDGEHYYLNTEEWDYLSNTMTSGITPTYLLYDSTGVLINKMSGYPGTEEIQKQIQELLP